MKTKYLFFGQYLRQKGVVTNEDIFNARMLQKQHNRRIGEIAIAKGFMNRDQVERVLVVQEETMKKFGDVAMAHHYIKQAQLDLTLAEMEDKYLYFGEALVRLGLMTEAEMDLHLKEFTELHVMASKVWVKKETSPSRSNQARRDLLNHPDCCYIEDCAFYNSNDLDIAPNAVMLRLRHCLGDPNSCARHLVAERLGMEAVPHELLPDRHDLARSMIGRTP